MIQGNSYTVHIGNNLDILPTLPDNSVDSIVTDPPYELGFMGKKWDNSGIAYSVELWTQCLRVLKPGGHLLSFGGTRTWHRVAVAIEDAGFEVRDSIAWMYGSGFPKSLDVSKAIDKKPEANSTKQFKLWLGHQIDACDKSKKQIDNECGFTACSYAKTDGKDYWSTNHPSENKWAIMKRVIGLSDEWDWIITDNIEARGFVETTGGLAGGTGNTVGNFSGRQMSSVGVSKEAKQWEGWGTALKPAFEPIVVARKPLIGTVAENVLTHGTGGLNIDGSRIGTEVLPEQKAGQAKIGTFERGEMLTPERIGRWPANVILDEYTAELLDEQSGLVKGNPGAKQTTDFRFMNEAKEKQMLIQGNRKDIGGASRFFYVAKASKRDRNEGLEDLEPQRHSDRQNAEGVGGDNPRNRTNEAKQNFHPTVKPTDLMRYLIKLVTPPGGVVLDPFTGSGSTGKAAILEGFRFIGCELTEDYIPIIEGRLQHAEAMAAEAEAKKDEALF